MYEIIAMINGDLKSSDVAFLIRLEKAFEFYGYEEHHDTILNAISAKDQDNEKDFSDFVFATYFAAANSVLATLGIHVDTQGDYDVLFLDRIFSALPKLEEANDVVFDAMEADAEDDTITLSQILAILTEDEVDHSYYLSRIVKIEPYLMQVLRESTSSAAYLDEMEEIDELVVARVKGYLDKYPHILVKRFLTGLESLPLPVRSLMTANANLLAELTEPKRVAEELTGLYLASGYDDVRIMQDVEESIYTQFESVRPDAIMEHMTALLAGVDFNEND